MALKILLAEDEEALSRVYKAALEHQGYEVDQAFNGQEAVDLAAQNAYQVMIMDIMQMDNIGLDLIHIPYQSSCCPQIIKTMMSKKSCF